MKQVPYSEPINIRWHYNIYFRSLPNAQDMFTHTVVCLLFVAEIEDNHWNMWYMFSALSVWQNIY